MQVKNSQTNEGANPSAELSRAGIDPVVFSKLSELMGEAVFFEFIKSHFTRTKANLEKIRGHIKKNDLDKLHFVLHTLKGSCANIGIMAFSKLCAQMEDKAVQRDSVEEIGKMLIELMQQFEVSKQALELRISAQKIGDDKAA